MVFCRKSMPKSKVAVVRCSSYEEEEVYAALRQGVDLLGGVKSFVAPGETILLKPNVLTGDPAERGVCTHPSVLQAAARLFRSVAEKVTYGDSSEHGRPSENFESCGIAAAVQELGLEAAEFEQARSVAFPSSPHHKRFPLASGVLATDGVVNLCKLKTHLLTRMTGAVKNLYGCIPGFQRKKALHVLYPTPSEFGRMLVALNLLLRPRLRLHIMDGVLAMEGNGPRSGSLRRMGVLLFSTDPVALDAVMCRLVELNPLYMGSARPGRAWGLGTYLEEEIEVVGDPWTRAVNGDFQVARGPVLDLSGAGALSYVNHIIGRRPVIDPRKCTRCGQCVQACPVRPKAVDWHDGNRRKPPVHHYLRCIRCYCCQEICPEGAISVRHTILKL
jgi:uncharacterized protein (DUF362 family)/NAD-dependent dihydropyrimidine dehydrogenase PreA subunit